MTSYYRCISLWEPWASLVVLALKRFETRGWSTAYRGPLLIHAAKKSVPALRDLAQTEPFHSALASGGIHGPHDYRYGCIIGVVRLTGCLPTSGIRGIGVPELSFGDFSPGRFAWPLENARRFETAIPRKGRQGFFNVPAEVVAEQMAEGSVVNA